MLKGSFNIVIELVLAGFDRSKSIYRDTLKGGRRC